MKITRLVYVERDELPDYEQLIDMGVIHRTDYNTEEVFAYFIRQAHEDFDGTDTDFDTLIVDNFGSDATDLLMSDEIDLIMVV